MRFILLVLFSLCFCACIDKYTDTIVLHEDGSATFFASIYPSEPNSDLINNIKSNYDSTPGVKFDSAWFVQTDSLYSLNFKMTFENLLTWQKYENFDKDFVGNISLKKMDGNVYSFKREINANIENEDGAIVPEEAISPFALELITGNDSAYVEYTLVLPQGAVFINSEPIDTAYTIPTGNSESLRWKFLAEDVLSKRILLKAEFSLPSEKNIHWTSLFGIVAGCIIMLFAIVMLVLRLRKLSGKLRNLENVERNFSKGE
jgi:hypothetical protein